VNTARSWLFAAGKPDFELRIAAPKPIPAEPEIAGARGRARCLDRNISVKHVDVAWRRRHDTIFEQAENRLHVQKAVLAELASAMKSSR
jgi:hypothetical protein